MPSKRRKMRFVFFILSISTTFKIDSALDQPENIFGNRSLRKCVDDEAFSSEKKSIVTTCANCCPNKKAKKKFCKKEFKYDGTKMEGKVWCPATCDNCSEETCQDNEDFTWKWKKGAIQYKNMTCKKLGDYLIITRKKICDSHDPKLDGEKTLVEEICPITCEACPSPAPSYTPSTAPPTMCQDNKDFKWKWKKGQITYGKLGCKKLGDYLSTTKKNICESHNPKFNGEKTLVEEICRETCGTCATPVPSHVPSSAPSAEPSLNPSDSHSVSPSALPSVLPSALPSIFPSARPSSIPSDEPSPEPSQLCTTQTLDGSNLESSGSGSFLAFDMKSLAQNTIQIEALEYRQIYQYGSFKIYTKQGSWTEATPINKSSESKWGLVATGTENSNWVKVNIKPVKVRPMATQGFLISKGTQIRLDSSDGPGVSNNHISIPQTGRAGGGNNGGFGGYYYSGIRSFYGKVVYSVCGETAEL